MFGIKQRGSTVGREVLGGVTTFMAMSYIIFVQVGVLGEKGAGMNDGGVFMATCLAAAAASILMGLLANYPIALAPGMGENFFFALLASSMAVWGFGAGWQMALALTFLAGLVFLALSIVNFRSRVLNAIPDGLKSGIASGIGLFIAVVGFTEGNLVVKGGALVTFPGLRDNPTGILTLLGLAITMALLGFKIRGAVLLGILATTGVAVATGLVTWCGNPVSLPSGLAETAGGFIPGLESIWAAIQSKHALDVLVFVFVLLFMDLFDTVGTLVGVANRAGLIKDGKFPKAERAMTADAAGTMVGACLGTSTVTSYIESITGVSSGARTGLAAIVAGGCMLLALFFQPLVMMIGGGIDIGSATEPLFKHPMIAPALIIVGAMMVRTIKAIDWEDVTEYLPAFLTMVTMPLAYSIAHGVAIGFVSYAFGKLVTGRAKECPILVYIFAVLFVLRYAVAN